MEPPTASIAKPAEAIFATEPTAATIAVDVRAGRRDPVDVTQRALDRIRRFDRQVGAFVVTRDTRALDEAAALRARNDLAGLPLAGVPVAIKDNMPVAGEPFRNGSLATDPAPQPADHPVVARLRAAGAIVVGITRVPELCMWSTTDDANGVARNPWDLSRTPGGSSGGSAAAVAAGLVPAADAADGLGSIRIPASATGIVGLKPGPDVVPSLLGRTSHFGLAENGPLATTVADAALMLSVMADRPAWARITPPGRLRVAASVRSPLVGVSADPLVRERVRLSAAALRDCGHRVRRADPPYPTTIALHALAYWFGGTAADAEGLDASLLEPRNRRHAAIGQAIIDRGLVSPTARAEYRSYLEPFFAEHDVLLLPILAGPPLAAERWGERSWIANVVSNARWAPWGAAWNLAGYPTVAVPTGTSADGHPIGVQIVAPEGAEPLLLGLAAQLEQARPWPRTAPGFA